MSELDLVVRGGTVSMARAATVARRMSALLTGASCKSVASPGAARSFDMARSGG